MGNVIPCGGTSRRNSSSGLGQNRGALLSANINSSGFATNPENSLKTPHKPHNLSPTSSPGPTGNNVNHKHPDHVYLLRHLRVRRPKTRALLALQKVSRVYDAAKWALDRLGVDTIDAASTSAVQAAWTARRESFMSGVGQAKESVVPNLVLLDTRNKQLIDADSIARSIRSSVHGQHVVMVAIVRKSCFEKEDCIVDTYLQAGFNRVIFDSGSRGYWLNELSLLLNSDVDTCLKLQCADTLFTALDHCRDVVQITDSQDKFLYGNNSSEKILGFSQSELVDRNLWDLQSPVGLSDMVLAENDSSPTMRSCDLIRQKLEHGKSWEGSLSCKKKNGESIQFETKALPVSFSLSSKRSPDHIVYLKQLPCVAMKEDEHLTKRRGSKTPRNAEVSSYDSNIRRSSNAKIPSMTIQTPISKVVHLLTTAREHSGQDVGGHIEKAIEILLTNSANDLFSPELAKEKSKRSDPVANDLLGALLSNSSREMSHGRRGSAEMLTSPSSRTNLGTAVMTKNSNSIATMSAAIMEEGSKHQLQNHFHHHHLTGTKMVFLPTIPDSPPARSEMSSEIRDALMNCDKWEFDILNLERITDHRCLMWLGMSILLRFDLHKTLSCSEHTIQNWLGLIEANYKRANAYHNSTHAADVLHATAFFLEQDKIKDLCDGIDEAICLIAAVIHDVDHPGKNSAFLCNYGSELATLYNDITVLENHHASLGFRLTASSDQVNIFKNLDRDSYKLIRQGVIDLVLATDMSKHFVHLNKFVSVVSKLQDETEGINIEVPTGSRTTSPSPTLSESSESSSNFQNTPENMSILKRMMIKCADVSNPARPLPICKEWAYRIAEEYFTQTDEEKRLGLPVVMPQFDRQTCSIPKSQLGFYDFFINDMFNAWDGFAELPLLSEYIRSNYSYWSSECEKETETTKSSK